MDIKKTTYNVTNKLESLILAIPMFVVGLGFIIIGVTIFPGIGILIGIFVWWVAWRFMLTSSLKSRIREALRRVKERQAFLRASSISASHEPAPKTDVTDESGAEATDVSQKQGKNTANSDQL